MRPISILLACFILYEPATAALQPVTTAGNFAFYIDEDVSLHHRNWWPAHHAAIEKYLAELLPLIDQHGSCIAAGLERAYGASLPENQPVRVDLAYVTNWTNAYTTGNPAVVHIGVSDPSLQGLYGLELMYHEVSHGSWTEPALTKLVERTFLSIEQEAPRRFWHVVIFITAGTMTRQCLKKVGIDNYQRYAEVYGGLASRDGWREIWQALDKKWAPFLVGESNDRDAAMLGAVNAYRELVTR